LKNKFVGMAVPKLIQYLATFNSQEAAAMRDFVASAYFCPRADLRQLLLYLLRQWPDFPPASCSKKVLHQQVYRGQAYDDPRLRYLLSDGCRLVELFWGMARYQKNTQQQQLDLLKELSQRGLQKMYESKCREATRQKMKRVFTEPEDYRAEYEWAAAEEDHFVRQHQRNFNDQIEAAAQALDRYYFFQQLVYACGMQGRQNILQGTYELPFTEHWLRHLEEKAFFGDEQISLYYTILQMQQHEDKVHFEILLDKINSYVGRISTAVLRSAYIAAINFCARRIRQGETSFVAVALDLYTKGLQGKVLLENGQLSPWAFNNVVKLALRLRRYDWIPVFMNTYEGYLPESFRADAAYYNRAELYYYTRRLEAAQEALLKVSYSDLNYYLGARVLLAKIYFERDEIEPLLSLLAAFTIFLKRNKEISADLRQTYLNFCTILFQITKRKPGSSEAIRKRIEETQPLTDREWLLKIV
jgi:hypothetical protein